MTNTDYSFYGGYSPYGGGQAMGTAYNPFSGLGSYSSYSYVPNTLTSFIQQQIPELAYLENLPGMLTPEMRSAFSGWRTGGMTGGVGGLTEQFLGREDVQELLRRSEYAGEGVYLNQAEGAQSLADWVKAQMGQESSTLRNIYGQLGLEESAVAQDIQRFSAGQQSGLGALSAANMFGAGAHSPGSREAVLAQLFGNQFVDVGGRVFNPFSGDILSDEYSWNVPGGELAGTDLLRLTGNLLSSQNLAITQPLAQAVGKAVGTGADLGYGGKGGEWMTSYLQALGKTLQPGKSIAQDPLFGSWIDKWVTGAPMGSAALSSLKSWTLGR